MYAIRSYYGGTVELVDDKVRHLGRQHVKQQHGKKTAEVDRQQFRRDRCLCVAVRMDPVGLVQRLEQQRDIV